LFSSNPVLRSFLRELRVAEEWLMTLKSILVLVTSHSESEWLYFEGFCNKGRHRSNTVLDSICLFLRSFIVALVFYLLSTLIVLTSFITRNTHISLRVPLLICFSIIDIIHQRLFYMAFLCESYYKWILTSLI